MFLHQSIKFREVQAIPFPYPPPEQVCSLVQIINAQYSLSDQEISQHHRKQDISRIIGSDIDERVLAVARRNLGLLTLTGLDQRLAEISEMPSRMAAISSL